MKSIIDIKNSKNKEILSWVTAYSYDIAHAAEKAGIDMILCGDSGYMCLKGYKSTNFATMDGMIDICKSVRKGASDTFIWGDMPSQSYEESNQWAIHNALRFVKEGESQGVKLEGGTHTILERIRAISDCNILVCGHLGLTPQSTSSLGGYRVQGRNLKDFESLYSQALAVEKSGASFLLLEAVPEEVGCQISKGLKIPVAGIGCGAKVDCQLLICSDLLGLYPDFRPKFAKCYVSDVLEDFSKRKTTDNRNDGLLFLAQLAFEKFKKEVRDKKFPSKEYIYPIKNEDLIELKKSEFWNE